VTGSAPARVGATSAYGHTSPKQGLALCMLCWEAKQPPVGWQLLDIRASRGRPHLPSKPSPACAAAAPPPIYPPPPSAAPASPGPPAPPACAAAGCCAAVSPCGAARSGEAPLALGLRPGPTLTTDSFTECSMGRHVMLCFLADKHMDETGDQKHLLLHRPARVKRKPHHRLTCSRAHRRRPPRRRRRPPRAHRAPSAASSSAFSSGSSSVRQRRWRPRRPRTPSQPAGLCATEEKHTRRDSCQSRGLQIRNCVNNSSRVPT